jgi:hypothetical protein
VLSACIILCNETTYKAVPHYSMGVFDQLYGGSAPGIVAGHARIIRSDEWLWQTQSTLIQKADDFPAINQKIGLGEDMSMILDVPYKSFFALFKPQNLFFFFLPLSVAFAAKWWFLGLVLMSGFYLFFTQMFPEKKTLIAFGSLLLFFNPFTQWWYQSITLMCMGLVLYAGYFAVQLFGDNTIRRTVLLGVGLTYSLTCFIFLLYPPFQIPIFYIMLGLFGGFIYHRYFVLCLSPGKDRRAFVGLAAASILTLGLLGAFLFSHRNIIQLIAHTAYPGSRRVQSGQFGDSVNGIRQNMLFTFSGPMLMNLQNDKKGQAFYLNQSEAATITTLNILLAPIVLFQISRKTKLERSLADYLFIASSLVGLLFVIRLFTPFFNPLFRLLLFDRVENERLAIGMLLLCVVQLILIGCMVQKSLRRGYVEVTACVAFVIFLNTTVIIRNQFPQFISLLALILTCLMVAVSGYLLLNRKLYTYGLVLFLIFNLASSIFVNPLYNRVRPAGVEKISSQITRHYPDRKAWIVIDSNFTAENLPLLSGKSSYSGIQVYPQLKLWESIDTGGREKSDYNRYGHVVFSTTLSPPEKFGLPAPDQIRVKFDCEVAKRLPNLGYALSTSDISHSSAFCLLKVRAIHQGNATFYIYQYQAA